MSLIRSVWTFLVLVFLVTQCFSCANEIKTVELYGDLFVCMVVNYIFVPFFQGWKPFFL